MPLKHKNLLRNLLLLIVLILVPVIALNAYIITYWGSYIKNAEFEKDTKFFSLAGQTFDSLLDDITISASLMEFDELLVTSMEGIVESNGQISPSKYYYLNSVWNNTSRALAAKPYILSAYFYIEKARDFVFTTEGIRNLKNFPDQNWLDSYYNQNKGVVYWSEVRNAKLQNSSGSTAEIVSLFRKFPFLKGQEDSKGVIVVNLNNKYFDALLSNFPDIQYKKVYILDDKNVTVYKNCEESYDTYLDISTLPVLKKNQNIIKNIGNQEYLISTVQSKSFDWVYVSVTPTKFLLGKLGAMTKVTVIGCIMLLIISIMLSIFYTLKNYRPVKTMIGIITQYNKGNDISSFASGKDDEYGYIIYNMIRNFIDKNEIQKKLTEEKLLQKEAQLNALQSQINPHFLYNTLETLNWEAIDLLGRDNSISKILLHLANNLRYVTNYSNALVTIEEDVSHLKSYVYMHEMLSQDRLQFIFDVNSHVISCKTFKLLIQPIVENAVIHGLSNVEKGGKVKIVIKTWDDTVRIKVIDNGTGINKSKLSDIRQKLNSSDISVSRNLGLNNINQRIKIKFGEKYGVSIRSKEGFGTAVYITLPCIW